MGWFCLIPSPPSPQLLLSIHNHHRLFSFVGPSSSTPFLNFRISRQQRRRVGLFSLSVVEKNLQVSSWSSASPNDDDHGGWAIFETTLIEEKKTKLPMPPGTVFWTSFSVTLIVMSILAVFAIKLKLNAPWNVLQSLSKPFDSGSKSSDTRLTSIEEESSEEKVEISASESVEKLPKRVIICVAADATQEKALRLLKKLKIIDDDVKADAFCTRREYARWLLRANILLERNPKQQISMLPSGSFDQAFDDVSIEDPDFRFVQALAESGIVRSKLSEKNFGSDLGDPVKEGIDFYPESFISRMDLINWKTQLEYSCMPRIQEISTMKIEFMDVSITSPEASSEFFMDMLAGDKSILRKVFGQSRRFQPQKPATKAQAAVALTSGRMAEAIRNELLRLETENLAMLAEMEEIRSELLIRGEIQRSWEKKLIEVKTYGQEAARHFDAAISDLEQEKSIRHITFNENLKEGAALDCQRKLLVNLKEEVKEMSERLACERANLATEQKNLEDMFIDLQGKQEAIIEVKSILEAEKEALRMLRSWIEDEARRSQARARVLEQVGRRWRWNEEA